MGLPADQRHAVPRTGVCRPVPRPWPACCTRPATQLDEVPTRPHPDKVRSFERARPNQLWQTDLFTFVLKRQNRRVYLVAFLDDHSRFLTGYGLHASQSAALVIEVSARGAGRLWRRPKRSSPTTGAQYVTWRGKSQFTRELEKRGIRQIVARPRHPADPRARSSASGGRSGGSVSRRPCSATWKMPGGGSGCSSTTTTSNGSHQGIDGLVPADRYFGAAPEVLKTLRERVAANALELARHGVPKQPVYLTGLLEGKPFSVHREGDRVILHRGGEGREEIDLPSGAADRPKFPARRWPNRPAMSCRNRSVPTVRRRPCGRIPESDLAPANSALDDWSEKTRAAATDEPGTAQGTVGSVEPGLSESEATHEEQGGAP